MKPQYLFVCITHLQLISSLNILDEKLTNGEEFIADLILLSDGRAGIVELENRCKTLGVFRHVIFLPNAKNFRLKAWLKNFGNNEIKFFESLLYTSKIFRSTLLKLKSKLKFHEYDAVYFFSIIPWSRVILRLLNKQCKHHLLDEGVGSYTSPKHMGQRVDFLHLYEPELVCLSPEFRNKIIKLNKITQKRERLLNWLKKLFQRDVQPLHEVIFFDQPLEKRASEDDSIFWVKNEILIFFVNRNIKENLIVRAHPWTSADVKKHFSREFGEVYSTASSNVPFEIELLFGPEFPKEFHTISSSGVLYWLFMFDNSQHLKSKIYIYYPWVCKKLGEGALPEHEGVMDFFTKVQKKFPNQIVFVSEPGDCI